MPVPSPGFDLGFFALFVDGRGQGLPGMADQRMPAGAQIVSGRGLGRRAGRREQGHSWFTWNLSVGGFASEAAVEEPHLAAEDVIAEAPAAERQAVLAFSQAGPFEFLDVVCPCRVVGVGGEGLTDSTLERLKIGLASEELLNEALVMGSGVDRKRRRHSF